MSHLQTKEINTQVVISLLKAHGINTIVSSPGATNVAFVASVQNDPYFEVYSAVDERSAAYIACGMAEELGKPIVISCTGATASRNYIPGLTEAYYRKLPVLAITSTQPVSRVGHHIAQVIDRSSIQNDIVKLSVDLPIVNNAGEELWDCEIKVNKAILELTRNGGGPAHINLPTTFTLPFESIELPNYRVINRLTKDNVMPKLEGKIAIFIGSHLKWTAAETDLLDKFCDENNAVVFCDHTSGYKGRFRLLFSLITTQDMYDTSPFKPNILIHIGEVSGDYYNLSLGANEVWRVNEDGELRDTFKKLRYIFQMTEKSFFSEFITENNTSNNSYFDLCNKSLNTMRSKIPELPFSNLWVASKTSSLIPDNSVLHLGILNSLRSWNFFEVSKKVNVSSNVGGFGIDGALSTVFGNSLIHKDKLCFCVLGDLAFFYDMNVLGNRHLGTNLRILLINNGKGTEFRQYNHHAAYFGEKADELIAAAEHFGNKSPTLVKHYVESLGFEYMSASNKDDFLECNERFLTPHLTDKPILFEVFTDSDEESKALELIRNLAEDSKIKLKKQAKKMIGTSGINALKKVLKK